MGTGLAFALSLTLSAGIRPLDRIDPWTGEELVSQAVVRQKLDPLDPWTGAPAWIDETTQLRFDHANPWER